MDSVKNTLLTILDILRRIPGVYLSWVKSLLWLLIIPVWNLTNALRTIIKRVGETTRKVISWILSQEIRIRLFSKTTLLLTGLIATGLSGFYFYTTALYALPRPTTLIERAPHLSTRIYDRNQTLLFTVFKEENRTLVTLNQVPEHLIQATIAIEDKNFYQHPGFSIPGIIRALRTIILEDKLQGGSTITQQLVKNALLTPERTLARKIRELILALQVEAKYSKNEILQMYLNEVNYGGPNYGVAAAAKYYFKKPIEELTLAESALLAGLPRAPSRWSPTGADYQLAKTRQEKVLQQMVGEGYITFKQAQEASEEPLNITASLGNIKAPHFVMYIRDILMQKYGRETIERGGLDVHTSLDLNLQNKAQEIVRREVVKLAPANVKNGAALITNPQTGEILAMVGSADFFDEANSGQVNLTLRPRQPGSAIKPLLYSLALQNGYNEETIIEDTPTSYPLSNRETYQPVNYDGQFHGSVTVRVALASSYNIPAVKVLNSLGVKNFVEHAQKMGVTTWNDPNRYGLSLALGGGEVKMIDLAQAYGILANRGFKAKLNPILKIIDYRGQTLEENGCASQTSFCPLTLVLPAETARTITDILADNKARTPAFGAYSKLEIPGRRVAVKTGTTQNFRDNWCLGYTPDYLVSVWVGNNDNQPMSRGVVSGLTGATPIWNQITKVLLGDWWSTTPSPLGVKRTTPWA